MECPNFNSLTDASDTRCSRMKSDFMGIKIAGIGVPGLHSTSTNTCRSTRLATADLVRSVAGFPVLSTLKKVPATATQKRPVDKEKKK